MGQADRQTDNIQTDIENMNLCMHQLRGCSLKGIIDILMDLRTYEE